MSGPSHVRAKWAVIAGVPLLFAAIAALQVRIDAQTRSEAQEKAEVLLRSGGALKKLSLGYDALLGDIYWTRVVQYYGARAGKDGASFELLWPLLDITTTLDPKLMVAYRFGAIFLSEQGTVGANRPDLAVTLLKRGIAANPDQWRLSGDLGFLYYWRLKDYQSAAAAYLEGSTRPGAAPWLKMMAARVLEKGGSLETSRMLWSELYDSTKEPSMRHRAAQMLRGLKTLEDEQSLDDLAEQYQQRFERYPPSTRELRDAGMIGGIPVDPDGYPYVFGPDGKSGLNPRSTVVVPPDLMTQPAGPE
ncbi:MAG TPA: hypothetical protein VN822_08870 [Candidatus Acidoferrales bacterium]|nr:hypothetical protein [Candidatus Acidoferrales bacterium]